MAGRLGRVYVLAIALLAFFLTWALVAADPWAPSAKPDPRVTALQAREKEVAAKVAHTRKVVNRRWATYRANLKRRKVAIASAERKRAAEAARVMAIARRRRRVVYVTGSGGGGFRATGGGGGGNSTGGGGSGGGGGGTAAPSIVGVSGAAPVTSSGSS